MKGMLPWALLSFEDTKDCLDRVPIDLSSCFFKQYLTNDSNIHSFTCISISSALVKMFLGTIR